MFNLQTSANGTGEIQYLYHNAPLGTQPPATNLPAYYSHALSLDDQGGSGDTGGDSGSTDSGNTGSGNTSSTDTGNTSSGDSGNISSGDSGNTSSGDAGSTSGSGSSGGTGGSQGDGGSSGGAGSNQGDSGSSGGAGDSQGGSGSGDNSGDNQGGSGSGSGDNQGGGGSSGDSGNVPSGSGSGSAGSGAGSGTQTDPWIIDNFAIDNADLPNTTTGGQSVSDIFAAITSALESHADATIHVIGHTDNSGPSSHNQSLSEQRAAAAKRRLSQTLGNTVVTEGHAANELRSPRSADDDAAGHNARNRRVEIWYEASGGGNGKGCNVRYDVQITAQPDKLSCWAGAMAMLVSFRRRASINPESLASDVGRSLRTSYTWDMLKSVRDYFGFQTIPLPSNVSIYISPKQWCDWLTQYGPLWVTTAGNPSHAIIVAGLTGDGTETGSTVYILNPWDTTTVYSADPVDFSPVNMGRSYNQSFDKFAADFGNLGLSDYGDWRILYLPR